MINNLGQVHNRNFLLVLISLDIQFYLFRSSITLFKYFFLIIISFLLLYLFYVHKFQIFNKIWSQKSNYYIVLLLFIIQLVSSLLSSKFYLVVFKEIINTLILLILFFILYLLINGEKQLSKFINYFTITIVFFAFIISLVGVANNLGINNFINSEKVKVDYNFATVPVLLGIIVIFNSLQKKDYIIYQKLLLNVLLIFFSFNILLSGSRRGFIIFSLIILLVFLSQIIVFFKKVYYIKRFSKISRVYLFSIAIILFFGYLFTLTSCYNKNKILEYIGSRNIAKVRRNIAFSLYRCVTIFNTEITYNEFYNKIWTINFDSRDPDCGWGFNKGARVFPLNGYKNELVPKDAIGCLIDSSLVKFEKSNKKILLKKVKVNKNNKFKAEIFCYVSSDFDGSKLGLFIGNKFIKKEKYFRQNTNLYYDLNCKEAWQKLDIKFESKKKGEIPIMFLIDKQNKHRKSFKGNIILAYPTFIKIDSINTNKANWKDNEIIKRVNASLYSSVEDSLNLKNYFNENIKNSANKAGLPDIISFYQQIPKNNDIIRNYVAKLVSEDTTYNSYKKDIFIDTLYSKFVGPRINRWRFGWQIFSKEYNWKKKIFGGGFDFLNWYGYYFDNDKTRCDWPHNPFLHILLYSGIIGLALYILLLYKAFYYYIKYRKEYYIFFIFFLITFFFTFFSGGSPFDPPVMGFFVILPFFIHSVNKREEKRKIEEKQLKESDETITN